MRAVLASALRCARSEPVRERHRPEETLLYQLVEEHWPVFRVPAFTLSGVLHAGSGRRETLGGVREGAVDRSLAFDEHPPMGNVQPLLLAQLELAIAGCNGPVEFVTLEHVGTREFDRTYFPPDQVNVGGGRELMRSTDEIITHVEYNLAADRRFYVFDQDVETGIELGAFTLLPPLAPGAASRRELIFSFVNPQLQREWESFRVYDVGLCGGFVSWSSLADQLVGEIDAFATTSSAFRDARRVGVGILSPRIATAGAAVPRLEDGDTVSITVRYNGQPLACDNRVDLLINIELALQRVPGVISRAPHAPPPAAVGHTPTCVAPRPGSSTTTFDGNHFDFVPILVRNDVGFSAGCTLDDAFVGTIRSRIAREINEIVLRELRTRTQIPAIAIPASSQRACTCDAECNPESVQGAWIAPGRRHVCQITDPRPLMPRGTCVVQLEIDRVLFRPEGISIVLAENATDFQFGFMNTFVLVTGNTIAATQCQPTSTGPAPLSTSEPLPGAVAASFVF